MSSNGTNAAIASHDLDRVVVVGSSGSGKSTLSRSLAARLRSRHVELDAIHWLPGWTEQDPAEFRTGVGQAIADSRWVVDGNYTRVRDLVWDRATTIIWLNYSFRIVFSRAVRRTVGRIIRRETILNGNRETIRMGLLSFDGVPSWVARRYRAVKREYTTLFADGRYGQARVLIFRHPRETERFLIELTELTELTATPNL